MASFVVAVCNRQRPCVSSNSGEWSWFKICWDSSTSLPRPRAYYFRGRGAHKCSAKSMCGQTMALFNYSDDDQHKNTHFTRCAQQHTTLSRPTALPLLYHYHHSFTSPLPFTLHPTKGWGWYFGMYRLENIFVWYFPASYQTVEYLRSRDRCNDVIDNL